MPPEFAYYSEYILIHHPWKHLVWIIVASQLVACSYIFFFGKAYNGTSALLSGACRVLSVKYGIFVLLPSVLRGHIEYHNIFELLVGSGYDMNLDCFAHSRS